MPGWVQEGHDTYIQRLSAPWNIKLVEVPALKRTKHKCLKSILDEEGERLWRARPKNAFTIALDRLGKQLSSEEFSMELIKQHSRGTPVCFFIGGPEGLSSSITERANLRISLSKLTFPHPLVRVILTEQIFRARSIATGHPYHR